MATKTISIDLVAYERLCGARSNPGDSFSQVIRRARWDREAKTCGSLLSGLVGMPVADEEILDHLETAQLEDSPPDDPRA